MNNMLSISIVLYNTSTEDLSRCLHSLKYFQCDYFIYFIDNSPTDYLKNYCTSAHPFKYVHLPHNPGYGAAHNFAIRDAQANHNFLFHLVINADIYFDNDVIAPMIKLMQSDPKIGQMMPKVLNTDGSLQYLCKLVPSPSDLFYRRFFPKSLKQRSNNKFEMRDTGYSRIMFVPYLSGCFMLLRHEALKTIGLFDERFFMYPEDIDLTRRMASCYKTIFFPHVNVTHHHGAASYKSFKMLCIHIINIVRYFNKWGWHNDPIRKQLNRKAIEQFDE